VIEESQVVVHEGDEPEFVAHLLDPHVLPGEHLTEVDLSFADANAAEVGDGDGSVVKGVLELAEAAMRAR
jgi:hypothetical protein